MFLEMPQFFFLLLLFPHSGKSMVPKTGYQQNISFYVLQKKQSEAWSKVTPWGENVLVNDDRVVILG